MATKEISGTKEKSKVMGLFREIGIALRKNGITTRKRALELAEQIKKEK